MSIIPIILIHQSGLSDPLGTLRADIFGGKV